MKVNDVISLMLGIVQVNDCVSSSVYTNDPVSDLPSCSSVQPVNV